MTAMTTESSLYTTTVPKLTPKAVQTFRNALNIFTDADDQPLGGQLTETQINIIDIITRRRYPRTILILPTQYGKSMAVSLGVLLRVAFKAEKWAIIAPTEDKARIIMDYIIDHIFDDQMFLSKLEFTGTKEKLKQERSKTRITFKDGGEVRVYTANASNSQNVKKALMGFGSPNIILDESCLIPDDLYATIKRMLGGTKDNFLLEISNPFFRNHFYRMWNNPSYQRVFVDAEYALTEGRYTREYLDEMAEEAFYDVLYDCHFPEESELLPNGYRQLLSHSFLENSLIDQPLPVGKRENGTLYDRPILGIDPNHGGSNFTVMVLRFPLTGFAQVVLKKQYADLRDITGEIGADAMRIIKEWQIGDYRVGVDAGGVGAGVADWLESRGIAVQAVLFGQSAENTEMYANKKAELFWEVRKWIRADSGKLVKHDGFLELSHINYKENTSSKLQIEPKEELSKRGIASPDTADALALTFIKTTDIVDIGHGDFDDDSDDDVLGI